MVMNRHLSQILIGLAAVIVIAAVMSAIKKRPLTDMLFGRTTANRLREKKATFDERKMLQRNGTGNDVRDLIARLFKTARKKNWYAVCPAMFDLEGEKGTLPILLVTPDRILGINAIGFGGEIRASSGDMWRQDLNGVTKTIPNLIKQSEGEKQLLIKLLANSGMTDVPVDVLTVFTSPNTKLDRTIGNICYTRDSLMAYLDGIKTDREEIDPKKTGPDIASIIKKHPYKTN